VRFTPESIIATLGESAIARGSASAMSVFWRRSRLRHRGVIAMIADGTAPADLTVTGLAKVLPYDCRAYGANV
jgi:hypothetical protein